MTLTSFHEGGLLARFVFGMGHGDQLGLLLVWSARFVFVVGRGLIYRGG